MSNFKYVLFPGFVVSRKDQQRHYIGPNTLAHLYGVSSAECYIYQPAPDWTESQFRMAHEATKGLIELHPRGDGNYTLPEQAS